MGPSFLGARHRGRPDSRGQECVPGGDDPRTGIPGHTRGRRLRDNRHSISLSPEAVVPTTLRISEMEREMGEPEEESA
jgi:hypothetical protein